MLSKGAFTPADLDWIWTGFGQYLSPPNRGGLGKNSDRTQANVNANGLTSDWKWTGCHGEVVVHCTGGQQCAQVKQKLEIKLTPHIAYSREVQSQASLV